MAYLAGALDAALPADAGGSPEARAAVLHALARTAIHVVGAEIDAIEHAVQAAIPEAKYIDIEVDHPPPEPG